MLNYDEFIDYVKEHIVEFLPEEYSSSKVHITSIQKNNETLEGLTIKSEGVNIAPVIYLNDFYREFIESSMLLQKDDHEKKRALDIAMTRIATIFSENVVNQSLDLEYINEFEKIADKIVPRVVGIENNEDYLSNKMYTVKADLAITYAILLDENEESSYTMDITKEMADRWGTSAEVLEHAAKDNLDTLMPYSFSGLSQVLIDGYGKEQAEEIGVFPCELEDEYVFVLTNKQSLNGAAELINENAMEMIRETIQSDFYILPSSIHEVLCVRATENMNLSRLEAMVQEVNATQVEPQDKLSDHVYKYDYARHELYRADQEKQRQEELQGSQIRSGAGR